MMTEVFISDPYDMKQVRMHILMASHLKGIELIRLCELKGVSYNKYYGGIFTNNVVNMKYVNEVLQMLKMGYRLELLNGFFHKVFQSKMNEI